jgi:hypothetical protein
MKREIVVAHFNEDLSWIHALPATVEGVTVYWKGNIPLGLSGRVNLVPLPNVGHEEHSFLHHIVTRYDSLADQTLFTQGRWDDHLPAGKKLTALFSHHDLTVPRLVRCREWNTDGNLRHWGKWKDDLEAGKMTRARMSLWSWFMDYLGVDIESLGAIVYSPGSIMCVKREIVRARPKKLYETLLEEVSTARNPETAHYQERSWLYLFALPGVSLATL